MPEEQSFEPIAIVGMSCRLPGAQNLNEFWNLLKEEQDAIQEVPEDRWNINDFYDSESGQMGKMNTRWGGFLKEIDRFDADFFGITSAEANRMDPQQRLILEVSYEALQHAGLPIEQLKEQSVGVFIGVSSADYSHFNLSNSNAIDMYSITGSAASVVANRISYIFDFKGPSLVIDTACSSSLVALHTALQNLTLKECEVAIVGGVNLLLSPQVTIGFSQAYATAPDGRCKAFDARANGMVRGEGAGVVILKPLTSAQKDGDRILAIIEGSAVSQDGLTQGLTAPNPSGQQMTLKKAYQSCLNTPTYIETHGTGTALGDPIEAKAIGALLATRDYPCRIGSVKTNIGHLEAAAGIASLIKTVLALNNQYLPASLHFETPNPHIDFEILNLMVQSQGEPWPQELPLVAGVSSFGFGGTNAHIVLRGIKKESIPTSPEKPPYLIPLSAHNPEALSALQENYHQTQFTCNINTLAYNLSLRQNHQATRLGIVCKDMTDFQAQAGFSNQPYRSLPRRKRKAIFVFSGMGSQQIGMGRQLINEPVFHQKMKQCEQALQPYIDWPFWETFTTTTSQAPEIIQPILFAIQVSLAEQWKVWGVTPRAVIGSSMGEVAAAHIAGSLTLDDAAKIICLRIYLLKEMVGTGSLAIVNLDGESLKSYLSNIPEIWIGAYNSPSMTLVSGRNTGIQRLVETLQAEEIFARKIKGGTAPSHSPLMEPLKDQLLEVLTDIQPHPSTIPFYSTVHGNLCEGHTLDNHYWWLNVRQPIHLLQTIQALEKKIQGVYIELSPHPVLLPAIQEIVESCGRTPLTLASLNKAESEATTLYNSLARLYELGWNIQWSQLYPKPQPIISLPTYPWQHQIYWLEETLQNTHFAGSGLTARLNRSSKAALFKPKQTPLNRETLLKQNAKTQLQTLTNYLQIQVAQVLKLPAHELNTSQPLKNMGIGSLMGMELYNRVKRELGVTLSTSQFLKGPSIEEIAGLIQEGLSSTIQTSIPALSQDTTQYPLSFTQQRLWFIEQFQFQGQAYHIPLAFKIKGNLNIEALKQSFETIVERHQILKSNYLLIGGEPQQVIGDFHLKLNLISVEHQTVLQRLTAEASKPFNLQTEPLIRIGLFYDDNSYYLLLTLHHLVADGLSLRILFMELAQLYQSHLDQHIPELPLLSIQYTDYAHWQHQPKQLELYQKQLTYWQEQLQGIQPCLSLPLDHPRPAIQDVQGARHTFYINGKLTRKLKNLAQTKGVTLFALLLATFKLLLYRWSGQKDLVVGTPIAGRQEPELEPLIGLFLNILAIRSQIDPEITFSQWLQSIAQTTLEAYDHQDIPFEKVVEDLNPQRNLSHTPIIQVVMALHGEIEVETLGDLTITPIELDLGTSRFDLTLSFIPEQGQLKGDFEYRTTLFNPQTIIRLKDYFLKLLEQIITHPDHQLYTYQLIQEKEKQTLLQWGQGQVLQTSSTFDQILAHINQYPDALAVQDTQQTLTYQAWHEQSQLLAKHLQHFEKNTGIVAVFCEPSALWATCLWSIWLAGRAYLPLNPDEPPERLKKILSQAQPDVILVEPHLTSKLPDIYPQLLLNQTVFTPSEEQTQKVLTPSNPLAYVIFTSGTTGLPKGVMISHQNLDNLINWHQQTYRLKPTDRASCVAAAGFDAASWELWPYLASGASLHFMEKTTRQQIYTWPQWFQQHRITLAFIPTPILEILLNQSWPEDLQLRALLTGGDRLKPVLENFKIPIFNHYGPTENTVVTTVAPVSSGIIPPIGTPLPNMNLYVLNEYSQLVPTGVPGELYIGGLSLSQGYLNEKELTHQQFINSPFGEGLLYKSGDQVYWNVNGQLEFIGRQDGQIKRSGIRTELSEIEQVLSQHPEVKQALVLESQKKLIAYLIAQPLELNPYINANLPIAMRPQQIIFMEAFPLTLHGKINYKALPSPKSPEPGVSSTKFQSETEAILAQLWTNVLQVNEIDRNSSFFNMGGNSLKAIELLYTIQQSFALDMPLSMFFQYPILKEQAQWLEQQEQKPFSNLPQIKPNTEPYLPFDLTGVQQAYWVGRQTHFQVGGVGAYAYLEIDRVELDIARLNQALNQLIKRHPMLRMIVQEDGQQRVLPEVAPYTIDIEDLTSLKPDVLKQHLTTKRNALSHQLNHGNNWPLFSFKVSQIAPQKYRLHIGIDALMADASSLMILARELSVLYLTPAMALQPLSIDFKDYILALQSFKNHPFYLRSKQYWQTRLEQLPPAPELPLALDPNTLQTPTFKRLSHRFEDWQALKRLIQEKSLTPSCVLLAAFSTCLAHWSKSTNFSLNLTTFNRLPFHPEINQLIGDFTSLTLLEIQNPYPQSFESFAHQVQKQLSQDLEHRYYDSVNILRDLARQRGYHQAAMPVVFTSVLDGVDLRTLKPWGELVYSITQTPQVWLDHQVMEEDGTLIFNWDTPEELFPEGMLENMFQFYCQFLYGLLHNHNSWQSDPFIHFGSPTLNPGFSANQTSKEFATLLLHEPFFQQVNQRPQQLAIACPDLNLTYEELGQRVSYLAYQLQACGLKAGQRVAILMDKGWEQIVAVLAILTAGGVYVPLHPEHPQERIFSLLSRTDSQLVLTQKHWQQALNWPENIQPLCVERELPPAKLNPLLPDTSPSDLAYIIFTSGSTGQPKGVMISHESALNTILDINQRFNIQPSDKVFGLSQLTFDLSVYDIFGTLAAGATLVLPGPHHYRDPVHWLQRLKQEKVTVWNSVPTLLKMLVEYCRNNPERSLADLRLSLLSGDWIPLDLPEDIWEQLNSHCEIISLGGATEAAIWSIFYPIQSLHPDWNSIPYGKPLSNQTFHVLNQALFPCPIGVPGQLFIGGVGVAQGYWKDQEKTSAQFIKHPFSGERLYATGDLGLYLSDGNIEFLGREDYQVKIQGHRIELPEVEAALLQHPQIQQVVVMAQGERLAEKHLVAYLTTAHSLNQTDLINFLETKIPCYMHPAHFEFLEEMPITSNGKIDRKALKNKQIATLIPSRDNPSSQNVTIISQMICNILEIADIDPQINLISLGANSVDIIRLAHQLEEHYGFCPDMADLFQLNTVNDLALYYDEHQPSPSTLIQSTTSSITSLLLDPEQREAFKQSQPGIRHLESPAIQLEPVGDLQPFTQYRSWRDFLDQSIPFESLSQLLSCLRQPLIEQAPKAQYASAGALYPVQAYLYIKSDGVHGLEKGAYYYHPLKHQLQPLQGQIELDRQVHFFINYAIEERSKFSLFLIGDLMAIEPIYGPDSKDYCLIESGAIAQLLRMTSPQYQLGLCAIGQVDIQKIKQAFNLNEHHLVLHTLLGGVIDPEQVYRPWNFSQKDTELDSDDWEEFVI